MQNQLNRRTFMQRTALAGAALATWSPSLHAQDANKKIVVAVMGTNSRGMAHISGLLSLPNVEIAYICDVDDRALAKGLKAVADKQKKPAKGLKDFRHALEDKDLDAITMAIPNHWHTPATLLACSAGKHVYVEKPGSHDSHESELIVASARKHNRFVQMGNQRRSYPWMIELMAKLQAGEVGDLKFARCWYNNNRPSIGFGKVVPVPPELDFSLWQGPAPERPYLDNLVHYNWHWRWHWGNGELVNNGVHSIDLARWGLGVTVPKRVTCAGGRYHYQGQDDQETPDTIVANFDFGHCGIVWEGHSCHPRGFEGAGFGVTFYGTKGSVVIVNDEYKVYDLNNKVVREYKGKGSNTVHFENFIQTIAGNAKLTSEIEEGQRTSRLCHLGNIAWRTGHTLDIDTKTGRVLHDREAMKLWQREKYRKGWEPKV